MGSVYGLETVPEKRIQNRDGRGDFSECGDVVVFLEERKTEAASKSPLFTSSVWGMAGITTMVVNLAGAFSNLYFLTLRLPKNQFVGTAAVLFFIVNLTKIPLHVFVWKTINKETLLLDLKLVPAVLLGLFCADFYLVKLFKENQYRIFIITVTVIGALAILFK